MEEEDQPDDKLIENVQEESINYISDEEEVLVTLPAPKIITPPCVPNLVANYESASGESESRRLSIDL